MQSTEGLGVRLESAVRRDFSRDGRISAETADTADIADTAGASAGRSSGTISAGRAGDSLSFFGGRDPPQAAITSSAVTASGRMRRAMRLAAVV